MTQKQYRTLRSEIGTQKRVATELGITTRTIQRRETGTGKISGEAALALETLHRMITHRQPS